MTGMMLNFILGLLVLLATSINASAIPSADVTSVNLSSANGNSNASIPMHSREMRKCDIVGAVTIDCYCFNNDEARAAVDHSPMTGAINGACSYFTGGIGDPVSVYGWAPDYVPSYTYTYRYTPKYPNEQGVIRAAVVIDKTNPECKGPREMGWEECWYRLHEPLDDCDTDAVNGKNGGMYLKDCIWWILDPAPAKNEPFPFGVTCKSCDGSSKAAASGPGKSAGKDARRG